MPSGLEADEDVPGDCDKKFLRWINKYNSDTKKSEKKARKPRKTSLWNRIMKSPEPQKTERAVPVASIDLMTLTSDK